MKIAGKILVFLENVGHKKGHNFCSDQYFFILQKDLSSQDSCPSFKVYRRALKLIKSLKQLFLGSASYFWATGVLKMGPNFFF